MLAIDTYAMDVRDIVSPRKILTPEKKETILEQSFE
jgi:hypothetical protein